MKSLTMGHLAREAGVNLETVRYYERRFGASFYSSGQRTHIKNLSIMKRRASRLLPRCFSRSLSVFFPTATISVSVLMLTEPFPDIATPEGRNAEKGQEHKHANQYPYGHRTLF